MSAPNLPRIIAGLPVVIYEYTFFPDGTRRFTYLSSGSEVILGFKSEELLNSSHPIQKYIHREDWNEFEKAFQQSSLELTPFKWEGRIFVSNQGIRWVEAVGLPDKMEDGRVCWSGVISDIFQRKKLEKQQQETETSYQNLLGAIPLGMGIHQNGKLVYVNNYAVKLMEAKSADELIGRSVLEFVPSEDANLIAERAKLVMEGQTFTAIKERFITLKGREIIVETTAQPFNYNGKLSVQLIVRDITEQTMVQEEIRKTELLFSELFDSSPMAIVFLDSNGNVSRINKGFEEMFGYSISELIGKSLNEFIVPQELESEGNDLNSLISSNQVVRFESARLRKDKASLSVIIYGVPVHLEDKTIGIFGVYVDITERKKIEDELKTRNTELDNFVYKVSHDLRAPLSSILGLVNLAKHPQNNDNLKEYLSIIGDRVNLLDGFINDVLSHSKNLKLEIKTSKVLFENIIENTFNSLSYMEGAEKIKKSVAIQGNEFYSDSWRIEEIFRNLISNAIKYRKIDEQAPEIKISIKSNHKEAKVIFKDNGIGIHKQNLMKIFDMFYRASDQSAGSGIGLYIVKNAVEKLSGRIQVFSEPGVHTTFEIILPNRGNSAF